MKNIVVYLILGAMIFGSVVFVKNMKSTTKEIDIIKHALKPHDDYKPSINAGWTAVGSIEGVVVYRKFDCLENGVGCHWIYLSIRDGVSPSITVVK